MRDNRFLVLLYIVIYLVIVVSCGFVDVNDNRNSRNRNEDSWSKTRSISRGARSTFDTDKEANENLDVTFDGNMKIWLYTHDAVLNSSCTFSKFFGRLCYVYNCEKGNILYCEMDLRSGPCPESLVDHENSFHCWDVVVTHARGVHVCKLGGMVRSLGERSKLINGKSVCIYRDVMTFSGIIIEELVGRLEGKLSLVRNRRYFRREREDTTEAKQDEDDSKTDKKEVDGKTDGTTRNSKEDNDNGRSDKSKTEDKNEDDNSTSNSRGTTGETTENDVTEKPNDDYVTTVDDVTDENVTTTTEEVMTRSEKVEETTPLDDGEMTTTLAVTESEGSEETTSSDDGEMTTTLAVTESEGSEETTSSDDGEMTTTLAVTESEGSEETTSSDDGEMTTTLTVTESEGSEETTSSDDGEMTTTPAVTESEGSENTTSSDDGEMTTTPVVTESEGSEETTSSDDGEMTTTPAVTESEGSENTTSSDDGEMTKTPAVTEEMTTTWSKDDTVTTPKGRRRGNSRVDDSSFKGVTEINSLLSESLRADSELFTFQIERQIEKRINEGEISQLLRQKMQAMTESEGLSWDAAMDKLKNEIREHLLDWKIMTMAQNMLDDLGQDLKIGKDEELSR